MPPLPKVEFPEYSVIVQHSSKKIIEWFDANRNWVPSDLTEYQKKIEAELDKAFTASNQTQMDDGIISAITILSMMYIGTNKSFK